MGRLRQAMLALRRLAAAHPRLVPAAAIGAAALIAAAVTLALTLGGDPPPRPPAAATQTPAPKPPPSPHPSPTKRPHKGPLLDPFTGKPVKKLGRVLAVKVDNIVYARPQTGLRSADIIYVIPVEGGLTRFMAVYSSHLPPVVGPVRSARESDLYLLPQFGRPAFAWSGATPHLVPFVERSRIVDLYDARVKGYYRDPRRIAPYNLYARTAELMRQAPHASKARDIGFRFGALPHGGKAVRSFTVKFPAATYTFRWSATGKRWLTWMDGARARATEGGQLGGSTVVIQYVLIKTSRFLEYGGRPPLAKSVGSGRAVILRNGRAFGVHWSRPDVNGGTTYTLPDGKRMRFAPGQVWVVLAPRNHYSYESAARTLAQERGR